MTMTIEEIKGKRRRVLAIKKAEEATRHFTQRADERHAIEEMRNLAYIKVLKKLGSKIDNDQLWHALSVESTNFSENNEAYSRLRLVDIDVSLKFSDHLPILINARAYNHQLAGNITIENIAVEKGDSLYIQERFDDALIFAEEYF